MTSALDPRVRPEGYDVHLSPEMNDGDVWREGRFQPDTWLRFTPDAPEPLGDTPMIVPSATFAADPEHFTARPGPLGVEIAAGEEVDPLLPYLARLSLIALAFPKFSDGRNYSVARLLRERHGYPGELRAVGEVLADQIPLMRRCGIESFVVRNEPTRRALLEHRLAEVRHFYQPIPNAREIPAGTRPWLRRPAE